MALARSATHRVRRPMLLGLVFGIVLVLVGVTASALAAIASVHLSSVTLTDVVSRDASLVEGFVNESVLASDFDSDGPSDARVATLTRLLGSLAHGNAIMRIEVRDRDGLVLASDDMALVGLTSADSAGMTAALNG